MKGSSGYVIKEQPYWDVVPPALFRDRSIWNNHGTHTNITWERLPNGLYVREGASNNLSGVTVAHNLTITFTSGNFSGLIWVFPLTLPAINTRVMDKGTWDTNGWTLLYNTNGMLGLYTAQAAASQGTTTANSTIVANVFQLIGFTRSGASVRLYKNGTDVVNSAGVHINPVINTGSLGIGNRVALDVGINGYFWGARLLSRALSPAEHRAVFASEAPLFGLVVE